MIVHPNIKHCYDNNWTKKRGGCHTPLYSYVKYFGVECFQLMGVVILLLAGFVGLVVYYRRNYVRREEGLHVGRDEDLAGLNSREGRGELSS
jgi:hypothetical protein